MNLAYYAEFKSKNNTQYRVEIHTKNKVSEVKELLLSDTPFIAEWEADTLFKPLKMSNAVCSILTREILTDLYTGEAQGVELHLYNQSAKMLEWFGYLTPNLYTSDYITPLNSLDVEAIDSIACLENIKYCCIGERADFRLFIDIILYILLKADPEIKLNRLYIQNCNKVSDNSAACIFKDLYINERNFFDETNEAMTCKDALSSLLSYLGMTLMQWKDAYYIIDYKYINNRYDDFTLFYRDRLNSVILSLPISVKNISTIGIAESQGSISLDNVYNKVSVVANNNAVDELCPELFDDEDLENQNSNVDKYYEQVIDDMVFLTAYFKSKRNWKLLPVTYGLGATNMDLSEVTSTNVGYIDLGALFQKNDSYNTDALEPSSLNWFSYLTFVKKTMLNITLSPRLRHTSYLTLNKKNISLLSGGYLIIDFNYKLSQSYIADDSYNSPSNKAVYVSTANNKYSAGYEDTKFYCRLKIGDYYYNGEEWLLYSDYLRNPIYDATIGAESVSGVRQYYMINSFGNKVRISEEYYNHLFAQDRFLIVRKNNEYDKIYDVWYKPTNQVSYKENLSNASDGALIKLPDFPLYGEIEIELCQPTILANRPCHLTDGNGSNYCYYCHIKDFSVKYTDSKYIYDVFGNKLDDTDDIVYSNVINDNYVAEAEDVELLVNTHARNLLSYSNVATKNNTKLDYLKEVYSRIDDEMVLPEQILIDKLYQHHKVPKFIYKNALKYKFSPFDLIRENSLNREMLISMFGIDYADNSVNVTLIEL